jgi:hypothetical protein
LAIFFPFSQQGVSADIIQNSAIGNFSQKTEGTIVDDKLVTAQIWKLKSLMYLFSDVFFFPVHFEFFAIFSY